MRSAVLIASCALLASACQRPSNPAPTRPVEAATAATPAAPGFADAGPANAIVQTATGPLALPAPYATPSASQPMDIVPRTDGAQPSVPPGFSVSLFATGFNEGRVMALAPGGDVFVSEHTTGRLIVLRDENHDGKSDKQFVFASGLQQPFGLAFHPSGFLYVANTNAVVRFAYRAGQTAASGAPQKLLDLPGDGYHQHWTRNLAFTPDGAHMMVTVGSETNVEPESDPRRAAVSQYDLDGSHGHVFAGGLRNPIGLAFAPSGTLFTVVNERDELGDDLVPDYLTSVESGAFYGWPYSYFGQHEDPRRRGERPDLVARAKVPDLSLGAHVAPISIVFYAGAMFPAEYTGDAFVSLHGSWNRAQPVGYSVVRVRFREGKPTQAVETFASGWRIDGHHAWGRPAGLLVDSAGALLIADDSGGAIWRVTR